MDELRRAATKLVDDWIGDDDAESEPFCWTCGVRRDLPHDATCSFEALRAALAARSEPAVCYCGVTCTEPCYNERVCAELTRHRPCRAARNEPEYEKRGGREWRGDDWYEAARSEPGAEGLPNVWSHQELLDIFDRTADRPAIRAKIVKWVRP